MEYVWDKFLLDYTPEYEESIAYDEDGEVTTQITDDVFNQTLRFGFFELFRYIRKRICKKFHHKKRKAWARTSRRPKLAKNYLFYNH